MSELAFNSTLAPALLTGPERLNGVRPDGLPGGAPTTALPGFDTANPFADLLSGFLQGTQPPARAAGPPDQNFGPVPLLDEAPDLGADPRTLLALPGGPTPLPAAPGSDPNAGEPSGKALPITGNPLPTGTAAPRDGAVASRAAAREAALDATPVPASPAATGGNPRISLADLALSRPLEPALGSSPADAFAGANPATRALASWSLFQRDGRLSELKSPAQPLAVSLNLTPQVSDAPVATGAGELVLRRATTVATTGPFVPGAGDELLPGQLATFAASSDNGNGSPAPALLTERASPDTASAAQAIRPGNTTLPQLQPLAGSQSFAGGLADRLLTLGGAGAHTARLQLHPEHLGELNVEIQIDDGTAQVWFGTTTSQAREAIEASLPRLKELFADQGLALTRTQVDSGSGQAGHQNADTQRRLASGPPGDADFLRRLAGRGEISPSPGLLPSRPSTRLLDAWA